MSGTVWLMDMMQTLSMSGSTSGKVKGSRGRKEECRTRLMNHGKCAQYIVYSYLNAAESSGERPQDAQDAHWPYRKAALNPSHHENAWTKDYT